MGKRQNIFTINDNEKARKDDRNPSRHRLSFSELFVKRERLTELGGTYETNIVTVYPCNKVRLVMSRTLRLNMRLCLCMPSY